MIPYPQGEILHLTSAGHDFADAARSDSTWKKATAVAKDKAGGVTLDVMKQVLISIVKDTLGLQLSMTLSSSSEWT